MRIGFNRIPAVLLAATALVCIAPPTLQAQIGGRGRRCISLGFACPVPATIPCTPCLGTGGGTAVCLDPSCTTLSWNWRPVLTGDCVVSANPNQHCNEAMVLCLEKRMCTLGGGPPGTLCGFPNTWVPDERVWGCAGTITTNPTTGAITKMTLVTVTNPSPK